MNKYLGSTFDDFLEKEMINFDETEVKLRADRDVIAEYEKIQDQYVIKRKIIKLEEQIDALIQEIHGLKIRIDHLRGEYQ